MKTTEFYAWLGYYRREYRWSIARAWHTARCRALGERIDKALTWERMSRDRRDILTARYNALGARLESALLASGVRRG